MDFQMGNMWLQLVKHKVGNIPNPKYVAASDFRIASIEGTPTGLSVHVDSYNTTKL